MLGKTHLSRPKLEARNIIVDITFKIKDYFLYQVYLKQPQLCGSRVRGNNIFPESLTEVPNTELILLRGPT